MSLSKNMTSYIICGPTASGKSALALDLATHLGGSIINADSMQLYKELPLLSTQPSLAEQKRAPHYLYNVLSLKEACSVGKWLEMVSLVLTHSLRTPLIFTGGTGLYIKALLEGLSPIPAVPKAIRADLDHLHRHTSTQHLFELLLKEDPMTAHHLGPHNPQRMIRALEVIRHTKKSLLEWQKIPKIKIVPPLSPIHIILIHPERTALYKTIDTRTVKLLEGGAIEEVRLVNEQAIGLSETASQIIGYKEISAYLTHQLSYADMVQKIQQKTRNYAKRQMTWFRHQLTPTLRLEEIYSSSERSAILSRIESLKDNGKPHS